MSADIALSAAGLTKTYGSGRTAVTAVNDVSLEVRKGELALIMGPSGSGKTTLLSMLGCLLRPTLGTIFLNGLEVTRMNESSLPGLRAREIGFIFQAFNLLSSLTVEENVVFPGGLIGLERRSLRSRCAALMDRLGLAARARYLPRNLSGGEKQRVAIARALINNPRLVLADEPTGNLDSKSGHEVMMVLHDIARDEGRTVVIVTHDNRLEDMADRILWLEDGKLVDRKQQAHLWAQDPVCKMKVDQWTATLFHVHEGLRYFFCSTRCLERFKRNPPDYLSSVSNAGLSSP